MNGRFFELKKEKQDRMINAALMCFANGGYKNASTDDMVKAAGISKGLLFHYFESKIGVYTFVYEYSVRYITLELSTVVDPKETDIFEILKQVNRAYMHAMRGYPYMLRFLNRAESEDFIEAYMATEEMRKNLEDTYGEIWGKADYTSLPEGVDGDKLRRMFEFTAKGLMEARFHDASFQPEMLYEEIVGYLSMVKKQMERSKNA